MRATKCAIAVMITLLASACTSRQRTAESREEAPVQNDVSEPELIPGRTYTMNEVFPIAAESDLRFDARATIDPIDPAVIHTEVTIINARDARRRIEFERGCDDVRVRLYGSSDRTKPPVWDSLNRARPDLAGRLVACAGTGGAQMFKGQGPVSLENFRAEMKVFELEQGSLPPSTYYATAEIRLDAPRIVREIPAGPVVLRRR